MEHIFTPDDQSNQNYSAHANKVLNGIINVETKRELC